MSIQSLCAHPQMQGDEALDELAAARLHGYGAGLEDLRAAQPVQVREMIYTMTQ